MTSTPYMAFYVADYLGDTQHLSTEEHGAYLLLLMNMWRQGGRLPNEPKKLARIARVDTRRWHRIWDAIGSFFESDGDSLTQKRLKQELQKALSKRQKLSANGKAGGEAKALKYNNARQANGRDLPPDLPEYTCAGLPKPEPESPPSPPLGGMDESLWDRFRERWGLTDANKAETHFASLSESDKNAAIKGIGGYLAEINKLERKRCGAKAYLTERRWELVRQPPKKQQNGDELRGVLVHPDQEPDQWSAWKTYYGASAPKDREALAQVQIMRSREETGRYIRVPSKWPPGHTQHGSDQASEPDRHGNVEPLVKQREMS